MEDPIKSYKVLNVEPGAPAKLVRQAYIDLVRTWQPDQYLGDPVLLKEAEEKIKEIEHAYRNIRAFLPELDKPGHERSEPERRIEDLNESLGHSRSTKAMLIAFLVLILVAVITAAIVLMLRGKAVPVSVE